MHNDVPNVKRGNAQRLYVYGVCMKTKFFAPFLFAVIIGLSACSESTEPNADPIVRVGAELPDAKAKSTIASKGGTVLGGGETVDSLEITRVRFLIKELKLQRANSDTVSGDKKVKVGPILVTATATGATVFVSGSIPSGTYDKVKFEFHRLNSSEVGLYINDPVFVDFVTDDRYSFIIEGITYKDGVALPFTYRSTVTANLSLKFAEVVVLNNNTTTDIALQFDVPGLFIQNAVVLNPRDAKNSNEIDKSIKDVIKVLKKIL